MTRGGYFDQRLSCAWQPVNKIKLKTLNKELWFVWRARCYSSLGYFELITVHVCFLSELSFQGEHRIYYSYLML